MLRNYFFINLILVVIIAALGFKIYEVAEQRTMMPAASVEKSEKKTAANEKRDVQNQVANVADYEVIASLDLFRPTRSPAPPKELQTEKAPPKNPPKLFGTIILNEYKTAIMQDSDSKATKTYKINDSISGYILSDIREDKVVLLLGGETIEVKLRDDKGIASSAPPIQMPANGTPQVNNRNIRQPVQQPVQTPGQQIQQQPRIRRSRRPVPPRQNSRIQSRAAVQAPIPEKLPEEVEKFMENLEETDQ